MPLPPYRFELAFSGLCLFDLTAAGATVLLVNAKDPTTFEQDPDLVTLAGAFPNPHVPRFSYLMSQQIRNNLPAGVAPRTPDRVFAGLSGEEIGVCDLDGETVTLAAPAGAAAFSQGVLTGAHSLSSLVPATATGTSLNQAAVNTRFSLSNGHLETLRLSFTGNVLLRVDFRTIRHINQSTGNPDSNVADQLVLRIDNLVEPVEIRSDTEDPIFLRPDPDASGTGTRPVVASLSNFHEEFHLPDPIAAFDFLWFYELLSFTGPRPSRLDLPIPVYLNGSTLFTGSSGLCPPIKF